MFDCIFNTDNLSSNNIDFSINDCLPETKGQPTYFDDPNYVKLYCDKYPSEQAKKDEVFLYVVKNYGAGYKVLSLSGFKTFKEFTNAVIKKYTNL